MSAWTIDDVTFVRPDRERLSEAGIVPPEGVVRCVVRGTMNDGRSFVCDTWVTEEMLADLGEERVAEVMSQAARPPEEPWS